VVNKAYYTSPTSEDNSTRATGAQIKRNRPGTMTEKTTATDPRVTGDHIRELETQTGRITLIGVVHDHPASKYRVRSYLTMNQPDLLAVELPPLALSLFRRYADDTQTPPAYGGEMSSAIQAAETTNVVGIDGPSCRFVYRLLRQLHEDRTSVGTTRNVLGNLFSMSKTTLRYATYGLLTSQTADSGPIENQISYETTADDDPTVQAADEMRQIQRAQAVMNALEPPRAAHVRDVTRDEHMAARLMSLSKDAESIVAVVGHGHLDALTDRLQRERL